MTRIEASAVIPGRPDDVFRHASDWQKWAEWFEGVSDFQAFLRKQWRRIIATSLGNLRRHFETREAEPLLSLTGRMCAVLANPDRTKWKSETAPLEAEVRAAFDGLVAYCVVRPTKWGERKQ